MCVLSRRGEGGVVFIFVNHLKGVGILCWILQETVSLGVFQNEKEKAVYNPGHEQAGEVTLIFQEVYNLHKLSI